MKGQISLVKGSLLPQFSYYTLANLIRFFQTFRIGFRLRVYNMKIAEATNPLLMKSDPSSVFPPKFS